MMIRNYLRKTDRGNTPIDIIERAVDMVLNEGKIITNVGILFDIPRRSLKRYIDNKKKDNLINYGNRMEQKIRDLTLGA